MGYHPDHIKVRRSGRFSYVAHIVRKDDGLPEDDCPEHGWDGPPRNDFGTMLVGGVPFFEAPVADYSLDRCCCPVSIGMDLQDGPFYGMTHKRAWRKARRHMKS